MHEFQYFHKGQVLTGYGYAIPETSADHPAGMVDINHVGIDRIWRVVPFDQIQQPDFADATDV